MDIEQKFYNTQIDMHPTPATDPIREYAQGLVKFINNQLVEEDSVSEQIKNENKNLRTQLLEFFNGRGYKVSILHIAYVDEPEITIKCKTFTPVDFEDQTDGLSEKWFDDAVFQLKRGIQGMGCYSVEESHYRFKEVLRKNYKPKKEGNNESS